MTCIPVYGEDASDISPVLVGGDRRKVVEDEESSSSTSSIGRNSDDKSSPGRSSQADEGEEVQSNFKRGALDKRFCLSSNWGYCRRSISQFYSGKSKSFTNLMDAASCSSNKDTAKPENAYARKRKNVLAYHSLWGKNCNGICRSNSGGTIKRHTNSRSIFISVATPACGESCNNNDNLNSNLPSLGTFCLPPVPQQARRSVYNDSPSPPHEQMISSWWS